MVRSWLYAGARRALQSVPAGAALRLLESVDGGRNDLLRVLTYHRVAPTDGLIGYPGLVSASPSDFADQMAHVARRFRVVSVHDVLEARETGRAIGRHAVLVTFDDGYRDFAQHAWPVLRSLGLPVTLFVPTSYPGSGDRSFWWDRLHVALSSAPSNGVVTTAEGPVRLDTARSRRTAYRRLRRDVKERPHQEAMELVNDVAERQLGMPAPRGQVLDWSELRALAADGVAVAAHSRTHPLLDRIDARELEGEIAGSWSELERHVGSTPAAFAYPSGAHSTAVRDAVEKAGFRLAFTTRRGINRLGRTDWLTLRRINVGSASSINVLRAQLGPWAVVWSR